MKLKEDCWFLIARFILILFSFTLFLPLLSAQTREPSETELLEQERKMEKDLEQRVQNILDKVFGPNQSEVKAVIKLAVKKMVMRKGAAGQQTTKKEESPLGETKFILPGVPAPKNVAKEKEPDQIEKQQAEQEKAQTETAVKVELSHRKVSAFYNVKHEKKVPDAKKAVTLMTDLKEDELEFIPGKFFAPWSALLEDILRDPKNLLYAILLFLLLLLLFWLFVPLTSFFKDYVRAMKEKGGIEVKMESTGEQEGLGKEGMTPEEIAKGLGQSGEGGEEGMNKRYIPFSYINEENMKRLLGVFRNESPPVIALVLSYLKPELVQKIYAELPMEIQTKVAAESGYLRQATEEQVRMVDQSIKEKIDFLVGGIENLIRILDEVDYKIRESILDYLKDHRPQVYQKVRDAILLFEDILKFPDLAVQTIIRKLKTSQLAAALRNVSPEMMAKFTSNMSQGAQALLKEEMEFGRPLSEEQIQQERQILMQIIKELEAKGEIHVRERKTITVYDSEYATSPLLLSLPEESRLQKGEQRMGAMESLPTASEFDSSVSATPGGTEDIASYFAYGESLYQEGKYEEALPYIQYVIEADSSNATAYQLMGHCYYGLGMTQESLQYYEFAISLAPEDENLRQWVEQLKQSPALRP